MMIPQSRELIYYMDAECTKPFPYNEDKQRQEIISPVAVRKGESGGLTVYLRNESKNNYDILSIIVGDNTLQIDINKQTIKSGEVATLTLTWTVPENYPDKPYTTDFRLEGEFIIKE